MRTEEGQKRKMSRKASTALFLDLELPEVVS